MVEKDVRLCVGPVLSSLADSGPMTGPGVCLVVPDKRSRRIETNGSEEQREHRHR